MPTAKSKLINGLQPFRPPQFAAQSAPHHLRTRDFQRRARKLFSKAELKAATEIIAKVRLDRNRAILETGPNAEARDAADAKVRKTLDRLLSRALPGFRDFQAMKKAHLREYVRTSIAEFSGPADDSTHVRWGDLIATDDLSSEQFGPPFQVFDLHHADEHNLISNDQSFAAHSQGTMMNAFDFRHHYSGWLVTADSWFGLHRATPASAFVSCGINYTMPRAGRLRVSAAMQNFESVVMYSIEDRFGFSYSTLDIEVNLFLAFAHGGQMVYRPTTILSTSRSSDGGNISGSLSGFDTTSPYTLTAEHEESFPAGEVVQILAGCEVHIESDVDDMVNRVNSVVRWQLKKLAISVV
jgi:hypothetical protein